MLAVTIGFTGTLLTVTQDTSNPGETIQVNIVPGTVPGATGPVQTTGISIGGNTAPGSPINTGTFIPFNDPITGAANISGISLAMADTSSEVRVVDSLAAVTTVVGGGAWTVGYGVGGGGSGGSTAAGLVSINSPSRLNVSTAASAVEVDGGFAGGDGWLKVTPTSMILGKSAAVSGTELNFTTTGAGAITLSDQVTAASKLTISTNAAFDVSQNITAPTLNLTAKAGASQSGGTINVSDAFTLTATGGGVTFNRAGNSLAKISAITAEGQDVVLKTTSGNVEQTGAVLARSLALTASSGNVSLTNANNNVDQLGISAAGSIVYVDFNEVQLGAGGLGLQASAGNSVTIATTGNLTQGTSGRVVAGTFTASINNPSSGAASLVLDSANNQVGTFIAKNLSAGGSITFANTAVAGGLQLGDNAGNGISTVNGAVTITNGSGIDVASQVTAGSLGSIALTSSGAISQAATLVASSVTVTNSDSAGSISLGLANDVRKISISSNSSAGISFVGSRAGAGLTVVGPGISAPGGNISIDANNRNLVLNAGISTGKSGAVSLTADGGILQSAGGIVAGILSATNTTAGAVALNSKTNNVDSVTIANDVNKGSVTYVDEDDLTLATPGIKAGDSIVVQASNFTAPASAGLTAAGAVTVAATGTVDLSAPTAAGAGVTINGSGISVASAVTGGTAGSVKLLASSTGVTVTAPVSAKQDVILTGPTSVVLSTGAAVTATAGQISVTSSAGGFSAAAGIALTAGTDVTIDSTKTANVGGPVTSGNDLIVKTATGADVVLGGAVNAGGQVSLTAGNAVTTQASVVSNSFSSTSTAGGTTLNGPITAATTLTVSSGSSFSSKAALKATGELTITSGGAASISGTVEGSAVTLAAGTATAAGISISNTVTSTSGPVAISSTAAVTVAGISSFVVAGAGTGSVTLSAADGISQTGKITAGGLLAKNTTSGGILLTNTTNAITSFEASNTAAGGAIKLFNTSNLAIGSRGVTAANGAIVIDTDNGAGGSLSLGGVVSAGTSDVTLASQGQMVQAINASIIGANLELRSSGGDILLDNCPTNDVNFMFGSTNGGKLFFRDADALEIAAPITRPITTAGGAIGITSGGVLTLGGTVDAGAGDITLEATGGITGLSVHSLQSGGTVSLANNGSGNIVTTNPGNSFPRLSAISPNGTTIDVKTSQAVEIVGLGIQVPGGTIKLDAAGAITQSKDIQSRDATFLSTDAVTLALATNNVVNLAVQAGANVDYTDTDDFAVGVGGTGVVTKLANITLTSILGGVTLNAELSTGTDFADKTITTITAAGAILQTAAQVISGDLVLTATGGDISLPQATNDIANFRALASGSVTFVDQDEFEVGLDSVAPLPVPKPIGVDAGLNISLTAGPTIEGGGPAGLLRVSEGLVWAGSLTLKAGLNSRLQYVDFVVTNEQDPVLFGGSIRNMIFYANANTATQTINGASRAQPMRLVFDEAGYAVNDVVLTRALPRIVKPLDIDGSLSANGRIGINGAGTGTAIVNGLVYAPGSNDSQITGLAMYGFATGSGIQIASAGNTITNMYSGLQRDGTTIAANKIGIELTGQTATSNTIGTVIINETAANVIGGNSYAGIVVRNGATGNALVGNFVGTDAVGTDLGNAGFGISLEAVNGNIVGTRNAVRPDGSVAASNVIANNNGSGVRILNARAATANLGNVVENNLIDANDVDGIQITGSAFQTIGGQLARQANVITRQVGTPTAGGNGISVTSSNNISVFANFIGVDEVGTAGLGNTRAGVLVQSSVRTVISAGNRIGQNATGVTVQNKSTATRIEGNFIGTNEFDAVLGNTGDGIAIDRSIGNFVRLGNVIANSGNNGVNITDAAAPTLAAGNVVSANTIRGNATGIRIAGGARTMIGGAGIGNVITSNTNDGILVEASSLTGSPVGVTIRGNYVGTTSLEEIDPVLGNKVGIRLTGATGTTIAGRNVIANSTTDGGVRVEGSSQTTIGTAADGTGNIITTNAGYGVVVTDLIGKVSVVNSGNNIFGNTISGNTLGGVLIKGTNLANGTSATRQVVVGRSTIPGLAQSGRSNIISGNAGAGVTVDAAQGVLVQGNSIFENTGIPISIVNNGNRGAVAPTLSSAVVTQRSGSAAQVTVQGTFATTGAGTVTVENGRATFSAPQAGATVGSLVLVNGVGYRITQVVASEPTGNTVVLLQGSPSTLVAGTGRVASTAGTATFSTPQSASIVNTSIMVAGRSYLVTSLSANGRTARLAGNPTFLVSSFSSLQAVSFGLLASSMLGQQYVIDLYLNDPGDGTPNANGTGTGYGMRRFLGQTIVTVGLNGPGTFTATVTLPSGIIPVGQFITATASTMRAAAGTSPLSTSQASAIARELVFAGPSR